MDRRGKIYKYIYINDYIYTHTYTFIITDIDLLSFLCVRNSLFKTCCSKY